MKMEERVRQMVKSANMSEDSVARLVALAYWMGREEATRKICDKHNNMIADMIYRATECRYHKMVSNVIGDCTVIYDDDYAGEFTATFGGIDTEI